MGSVPVGHGACVQVVLGGEMRVRSRRVAVCTGGGDRACDGTRISGCSGEGGRRWLEGELELEVSSGWCTHRYDARNDARLRWGWPGSVTWVGDWFR